MGLIRNYGTWWDLRDLEGHIGTWWDIPGIAGLGGTYWDLGDLEAGVQTQGGEPKNFQYRLSSAETQQPVDRLRRKARGCLVLSVLC